MEAQALSHFKLFGYTVLRSLLLPEEVRQLSAEVECALADVHGDAAGTNTRTDVSDEDVAAFGSFVPLMADEAPLSQSLIADDSRLPSVAEAILGEFTLASPALATCLVGDTGWHYDGGTGEEWVRINAYLTPTSSATGALRVVPLSQHDSRPEEIDSWLETSPARTARAAVPGVALETAPGDVIVFNPRCHHGSWGGTQRLRWSVDFVRMPPNVDADAARKTRSLIEELSDWPTTDRWPTWNQWTTGTSQRRRDAMTKLRSLGVL